MKTVTHNNMSCVFNPDNHTYTLSDGTMLPSVTTYSKKYFPQFDSESVSKKYAEKNGLNQQDVLDKWAAKSKKSSEFGTQCHAYAELLLCGDYRKPINSHEEGILDKVNNIIRNSTIIGVEQILFSKTMNLAGTTDLLIARDGILYICDWKTNEEIKMSNKYQKSLGLLYMHDACDKIKYQTQLNLYYKIIKSECYYPEYQDVKLILFHIKPDCVENIELPLYPSYILSRL